MDQLKSFKLYSVFQKIISSEGIIVNGTSVFVKNKNARLIDQGSKKNFSLDALTAKYKVSKKKKVKIMSKFPDLALNKNQNAEGSARAEEIPTVRLKSSFPSKYRIIKLRSPHKAGVNLTPNSLTPKKFCEIAISQNPAGG